jgi:hypothetical protein
MDSNICLQVCSTRATKSDSQCCLLNLVACSASLQLLHCGVTYVHLLVHACVCSIHEPNTFRRHHLHAARLGTGLCL